MEAQYIFPPIGAALIESNLSVNFVKQNIASVTILDNTLARGAIARDDYYLIRSFKSIAICFWPGAVLYQEGFHRDVLIFVYDAWLYFMHVHFIARFVTLLQSVYAYINVFLVCLNIVIG